MASTIDFPLSAREHTRPACRFDQWSYMRMLGSHRRNEVSYQPPVSSWFRESTRETRMLRYCETRMLRYCETRMLRGEFTRETRMLRHAL
jgi:hypothetical protein